MKVSTLFSLFVLGMGLACTPAPVEEEASVDLDAEKAALMEADRAWSQSLSTADDPVSAYLEHVEDDARVLAPEMPLATGKEEIRATMQQMATLPGFSVSWTPSVAEVSEQADLGYTIGSYVLTVNDPEGTPVETEGKYLTTWRKQPDGSWKVTADCVNPNAPAPAPE